LRPVVIPAYQPSAALAGVVRAVAAAGTPIFVIDDGSDASCSGIFAEVAKIVGVRLLRHESNRGKGAALKTGIAAAAAEFPDCEGVITADADGQHHPDDIALVSDALRVRPGALILGSRAFQGEVPLRSRFGNAVTRGVMHAVVGQKLKDTQTGLRGIPAALFPALTSLQSNGYEFELEMLLAAKQQGVPAVEVPIRTIYEQGNASSHFHPVRDSARIYSVLLRFTSASLVSAAVDNLIFYLAYRSTGHILVSQIAGRILAVAFNYWLVRTGVFYSRERHSQTLPKYLALVVVSGSASYAGIRFLTAQTAIGVMAAKLMVESALFFVNFAVQRSLIFKRTEAAPETRSTPRLLPMLCAVVLVCVAAVEVYGFATGDLFHQFIWLPGGIHRLGRYSALVLAVGLPLMLMASWCAATLAAALAIAGTAAAAGIPALLATALFLVAAWAVGSRILGRPKDAGVLTVLAGIGGYIFLMNVVARLPVNYPAVWAILLLAPIIADLRGVGAMLGEVWQRIRAMDLSTAAERAGFALLIFVLGMHWLVALKPEVGADGLAMHLAIPVHIAAHHRLAWEPARVLWSVMPMGADWVFTIVYLLGGEAATHLINFTMLLAVIALLYAAVRRWLSRGAAMFLAAIFATTPLVQLVTGSLFVENMLAAMLLGMTTALWRFWESRERRWLYIAAILAGTALTIKLGAFAIVVPAFVLAAIAVRGRWKHFAVALAILVVLGAPSYAIAIAKTGNPFFPFLNQSFHSAVLPHDAVIKEFRFRQPLSWKTLYDLTFHTHLFYEGQDGSFGYQYLALAPLALLALLASRRAVAISAAAVAFSAALIVLGSEPNARYLYPALPLLFVPCAALLGWAKDRHRWLARSLTAYLLACAALNIWFSPASSWYHKDFYSQTTFRAGGRERFLHDVARPRDVAAHYAALPQHPPVLLTADADVADVAYADVYLNNWHQYSVWRAMADAKDLSGVAALIKEWGIQYFLARRQGGGYALEPMLLGEFLETCTVVQYEREPYYLSRLDPTCLTLSQPELKHRAGIRPLITGGPGKHDDTDPEVRLRGFWARGEFAEAYDKTVAYTDIAGSEAALAFNGSKVTWIFTKAPNRGIAEVDIDGVTQGAVDLYNKDIEWQFGMTFSANGSGLHVITIHVEGKKNPDATNTYVDVDAFAVAKD